MQGTEGMPYFCHVAPPNIRHYEALGQDLVEVFLWTEPFTPKPLLTPPPSRPPPEGWGSRQSNFLGRDECPIDVAGGC